MRWRRAAAVATAAIVLTACGTGSAPPSAHVTGSVPRPPGGTVTKLLVFVVENHSLDQMRGTMPYTFGLARDYGYATAYSAITHPSLPNYLAMTGGSTFGVTDDDPPASHVIHGPSVFGQALSLGRTATLYAEAMPGRCVTSDAGPYAVKHNPWAYFADERSLCERHDVPLTELAGDVAAGRLPNAGMVIPDLCHDAHDCDLSEADGWLRDQVGNVLEGPDWRSGHLLVVVTADEDDHSQGNLVLTVLVHPSLRGTVTSTPLTHYSLARSYAEVLGSRPLGGAADAPSLTTAFGLETPAPGATS